MLASNQRHLPIRALKVVPTVLPRAKFGCWDRDGEDSPRLDGRVAQQRASRHAGASISRGALGLTEPGRLPRRLARRLDLFHCDLLVENDRLDHALDVAGERSKSRRGL